MAKIRAYTGWNERTRTHYYTDFEIVDKLPEIGVVEEYKWNCYRKEIVDIREAYLDCDQGNSDVYNYDYYEISFVESRDLDENDEWIVDDTIYTDYVAIEKKIEDEEE